MSQACQCLRGICRMPSITCFNFWSVLKSSGSWTRWSFCSVLCYATLFTCVSSKPAFSSEETRTDHINNIYVHPVNTYIFNIHLFLCSALDSCIVRVLWFTPLQQFAWRSPLELHLGGGFFKWFKNVFKRIGRYVLGKILEVMIWNI